MIQLTCIYGGGGGGRYDSVTAFSYYPLLQPSPPPTPIVERADNRHFVSAYIFFSFLLLSSFGATVHILYTSYLADAIHSIS